MYSKLDISTLALLALSALTACTAEESDMESEQRQDVGEADDGISTIAQVSSRKAYASDGTVTIARPQSQVGDLLVLFLSRTDDYLPLRLDKWKKAAECFKTDNGQPSCLTEAHCTEWYDASYCQTFGAGGVGRDLAQVVFYRKVVSGEPSSYTWDLKGSHPAWAIMISMRGAATSSPIRAWAGRSNDGDADSKFPSVPAMAGDMLLLSQSFDDAAAQDAFGAPSGTSLYRYVVGTDETGYVFGKLLSTSGPTGTLETIGAGGPDAKDLMISIAVKPAP